MALAIAGCFTGCATKTPVATPQVLFPAPPDEPRIQYLWSFGSEAGLGKRSSLETFVTGTEGVHRPILKPYGVAIKKGKIYVCDTQAGNLSIADLERRRLRYLRPEGQAAFKLPANVAVDDEGTIFVTDTGRQQLLIFNAELEPVAQLGNPGEMRPAGVAVSGDRVYVTDMAGHCVRVYNKASRELLFTFPKQGAKEEEHLFNPSNIAVDGLGRICVSDSGGFAVKIFDKEGKHLQTLGELGVSPGRFAMPKGVAGDREGRVYVVDAAAPVVQLFDPKGQLLMFFGQPASSGPGGLYLPAGIAVDYESAALFQKYAAPGYKLDYVILVVNQAGARKVAVYGFLQKS